MHLFIRVKWKPGLEEVSPAEKAAQHRHLDSPSWRETLLPYLHLPASKKQIGGKPPQRRKSGGIPGVPRVQTSNNRHWEGSEVAAPMALAQGTHYTQ